jgi:hypothetical protein
MQVMTVVLQVNGDGVQVFLGILLLDLELLDQEPDHLRLNVTL